MQAGKANSLFESAEQDLILSIVSGTPVPRFVGILQGAPNANEICDRLEERLGSNAKEVRMFRAMNQINCGAPEAARSTVRFVLEELDRNNDVTVQRERAFFDFIKDNCDHEIRERLLSRLAPALLPVAWSNLHGESLLSAGRLIDAERYCRRVLTSSSDHIAARLFKAKVLIARFNVRKALDICRAVLESNSNNHEAQSLVVAASRLVGINRQTIVQEIQDWAGEQPEPQQQEYFIRRLLDLDFPDEAFVESWKLHSEDCDSAANLVGASLLAVGEYGLAKSLLAEAGVTIDIEKIESLERKMNQSSFAAGDALKMCDELAGKIEKGLQVEAICLSRGISSSVSPAERLCAPAVLMKFILEVRKTQSNTDEAGPIAFVSDSLEAGGAQRQIVNTAIGLKKQLQSRSNLIVLCSNLGEQYGQRFFVQELRQNNIKVKTATSFPSLPEPDDAEPIFDHWPGSKGRERIANFFTAFKNLKPRVVYAFQDETNILAAFASLLAGVPRIVLSTRSLNPSRVAEKSEWLKLGYQMLLQDDRVVLVNNSHAGADDYCQWLQQPKEAVKTIRNGFDFAAIDARLQSRPPERVRQDFSIPQDAIVVGVVAQMRKVKRPAYCLSVIIELQKSIPNLYGLIIGVGPLRQYLLDATESSPFIDWLRFSGTLNSIEPALAAMNVLLLGSEIEGLPNVIVEAQSVGTFVATTDVGGAGEAFVPNETGIVIPGDNAKGAAKLIAKRLENRAELESASRAARVFARENFDIEPMIQNTIDALQISDLAPADPNKRQTEK